MMLAPSWFLTVSFETLCPSLHEDDSLLKFWKTFQVSLVLLHETSPAFVVL